MQDVESPLICLSTTATLHILKTSMLCLTVSIQKHAATLNFSLKIAFYLTLNLTLNLKLKFKLKSPRWKRVSTPPKLNLIPPKHRPRLIKLSYLKNQAQSH